MAIKYRHLNKRDKEIRILVLKPSGSLSEPLRGTLQTVELSQARFYALSYVWGQNDVDHSSIELKIARTGLRHLAFGENEAYKHTIGSNLSRALRYLRQKYNGLTIWTDALCINQDDKAEKTWQVGMMDAIYSRAEGVHAWLGPEYNVSQTIATYMNGQMNAAFSIARKVWSMATQTSSISDLKERDWLELCVTLANSKPDTASEYAGWAEQIRATVRSDRSVTNALLSVDILSCNTYFSRVWILQEGGRARRLTFHYGSEEIEHRPLLLLLALTYSLYKSGETTHQPKEAYIFDSRFLRYIAARTTCLKNTSLLDVLVGEYHSPPPLHEATDSRDLVYARLGLSNDPSAIESNYDVGAADVFTNTSRFLLGEGFTEPLITFRPYMNMQWDKSDLLPSWAHDWSKIGINLFAKYNAAHGTSQKATYKLYHTAGFRHAVMMRGVQIGVVHKMNSKFSTIATAAGVTKDAIRLARLRTMSESLSVKREQTLESDIKSGYRQLGLYISDQDLASIFAYKSSPFAIFWCWWVYWITTLTKMVEDVQDLDLGLDPQDVGELLFRDQPQTGQILNAGRFDNRDDLATLLNYSDWSQLLQDDATGRATAGETLVAESAEILFRSAWGLRCTILHNGWVGYVPEETEIGDQVVIFLGVKAPLVIRKRTKDAYGIIGPAHICGVMQGQYMKHDEPVEVYTLV